MIAPIPHAKWLAQAGPLHDRVWPRPQDNGHDTWAAAMTQLERGGVLIGEHNQDIFYGELGLSLQALSMLAENRAI